LFFRFFKIQDIPLALADWQYGLLVLSTVLIAAGGYVINNILDQKNDAINKPNNVIIGKIFPKPMRIPLYGTYGCWRSNWFYLSNVKT
jgi:4-hydroxybenzoate polyprenyltransferase